MKLTEHQISTIYRFTDPSCIDQSKLISYLELHKTVKNKVFNYCSKIKDKNLDSHGYCSFLDKEPMYTPVDRETFIRRIPFYFYQIPGSAEFFEKLCYVTLRIVYFENL